MNKYNYRDSACVYVYMCMCMYMFMFMFSHREREYMSVYNHKQEDSIYDEPFYGRHATRAPAGVVVLISRLSHCQTWLQHILLCIWPYICGHIKTVLCYKIFVIFAGDSSPQKCGWKVYVG